MSSFVRKSDSYSLWKSEFFYIIEDCMHAFCIVIKGWFVQCTAMYSYCELFGWELSRQERTLPILIFWCYYTHTYIYLLVSSFLMRFHSSFAIYLYRICGCVYRCIHMCANTCFVVSYWAKILFLPFHVWNVF